MTSRSGNEKIEEIDKAHVIYLMYKTISSSGESDDLSIGFQRKIEARERELTDNKTTKGHYHVRIYLKDSFGFAEHQDSAHMVWDIIWHYKEIVIFMYWVIRRELMMQQIMLWQEELL